MVNGIPFPRRTVRLGRAPPSVTKLKNISIRRVRPDEWKIAEKIGARARGVTDKTKVFPQPPVARMGSVSSRRTVRKGVLVPRLGQVFILSLRRLRRLVWFLESLLKRVDRRRSVSPLLHY